MALPLTFRGVPKKVRLDKADKMLDLVGLRKHKTHRPNEIIHSQYTTYIFKLLFKNSLKKVSFHMHMNLWYRPLVIKHNI